MKKFIKPIGVVLLIAALNFGSCSEAVIEPKSQTNTNSYKEVQPPPEFKPLETIDFDQLRLDLEKIFEEKTYVITYSAWIAYNNHVGNSWGYGLSYDGEYVESGSQITFDDVSSSLQNIKVYAVEYDSLNDYGSAYVSFDSLNVGEKQTKSVAVFVSENRGRYSGNTAKWNFEITVERTS